MVSLRLCLLAPPGDVAPMQVLVCMRRAGKVSPRKTGGFGSMVEGHTV